MKSVQHLMQCAQPANFDLSLCKQQRPADLTETGGALLALLLQSCLQLGSGEEILTGFCYHVTRIEVKKSPFVWELSQWMSW